MKPGNPRLAALRIADPDAFRARVVAALDGKTVEEGAAALRMHMRTLLRWIAEDKKLRARINRLRQERGSA